MRSKVGYVIIIFTAAVMIFTSACRKQRIQTTGGILLFSVDTLAFDTVFTSEGSYTTGLLIYNPQNEEVQLSSVQLLHGSSSFFHLNVDGFSGNNVTNLKIAAHDSLYVFATVNINPNDSTNPFIITDSLVATLNGKNFYVPFTAFGQNAHYIISDSFSAPVTRWLTDLPYVVIHSCVVGPGATLTIPAKCRVYMHQDARFFVYGALNVDPGGMPGADSVVFQGDRLDRSYFGYIGYPGEWGGFYFIGGSAGISGGIGNFTNAVIKNCGGSTPYYNYSITSAAVEVDSGAKLTIKNSIIENSFGYGIYTYQGAVTATSCLVNTTGQEALAVVQGGYDTITNCTFANYGTAALTHANYGTVTILDYFSPDGTNFYYGNLNAVMRNCIVYGSLDSEVILDNTNTPAGIQASLLMDHCLLNMGSVRESFVTFDSCIFNQDPLFTNPANGVFTIPSSSPAAGAGTPAGASALYGVGWIGSGTGSGIDIGCY